MGAKAVGVWGQCAHSCWQREKQDGHMCVSVWGGGDKTRGPDSAASGQIAPQISRSLHTAHARFVLCDGKTEY